MNITDVDDKTIKRSQEQKISLKGFTRKYEKAFFEDLEKLNIEKANVYPRATEHIKEMVAVIEKLLKKGYAYKANDGIYYKVGKFKNYGKLACLEISGLKAGARVKQDEYSKETVNDFALWKNWDENDGDVFWNTRLGKGRPGWHIECSVMSTKYLGKHFDIHTGGVDLVFPHHTNEIAQSEAANNCKFVNYWVHNEFLLVNGKKMSKSFGNFYTLRDLLKEHDAVNIRYLLMNTDYRQQLNFTFDGLRSAKEAVDKLRDFVKNLKAKNKNEPAAKKLIEAAREEFENAMDEDLNVCEALSVIFKFVHEINKLEIGKKDVKQIRALMKKFDSVLGLELFKIKKFSKEIIGLIKKREKARKMKNWKEADKIREALVKRDVKVSDVGEKSSYN